MVPSHLYDDIKTDPCAQPHHLKEVLLANTAEGIQLLLTLGRIVLNQPGGGEESGWTAHVPCATRLSRSCVLLLGAVKTSNYSMALISSCFNAGSW